MVATKKGTTVKRRNSSTAGEQAAYNILTKRKRWPFEVVPHHISEIRRYAVEDKAWQNFLAKIVKLPTIQHLHALYWYRFMFYIPSSFMHESLLGVLPKKQHVQIDSHLKGLKLSGRLNKNYRIIK